MKKSISLTVFTLLLAVSSLSAATHYVSLESTNPTPPYTNWATAATNIQQAVDVATTGDEVVVTNGVYPGGLAVTNPVALRSANGPQFTIISGGGTNQCVYLTDGASLTGFTLTNGYAHEGGGVWCASANAFLTNCMIVGNSATGNGGGASGGTLYNCTLTGNSAGEWGGGVYGCTLYNCIVYYNTALLGGRNHYSSSLTYCCTTPLPPGATGNIALDPQLASARHLSADSPCRGAGSAAYAFGTDLDGESWGNPPSIGCDEYHAGSVTGSLTVSLLASYTNVVVGCPVSLTAVIEGRTTESTWDFGDGISLTNRTYASHGWTAPGDYAVVLSACNESLPGGVRAAVTVQVVVQPVFYVAATSTNPQGPYATWATAANNIQDAVDAAAVPGALVLVTNGVYRGGVSVTKPLALRSVNGPQCTIIDGFPLEDPLPPSPFFGGVRCASLTDGASLTGFTLTNGYAHAGGGVWCASTNAFLTNCTLTGNSAWRNGGGAYGATLYNCTLTGNSAGPGGWFWWGEGGGVYGSTLYNCTLTGNSADHSGGANCSTLYNCTVTGNSATYGGGGANCSTLYNCTLTGNSAPYGDGGGACGSTLYNCTLTGNSAPANQNGWGGYGGGASGGTLYSCTLTGNSAVQGGGASGGALYNCTLTGNSATYGGGAGWSTLYNCIVYFNTAANAANHDTISSLNYCCTTPLPTDGVGNITTVPLFVDYANGNLRLQSNSPCINAGINSYLTDSYFTNCFDLDGRPRMVGGRVDMGAYEFQGAGMGEFIGWLQHYGLPTDGSADFTDPDGDQFNNWQEWPAGSDPTNVLSAPLLITAQPVSQVVVAGHDATFSVTAIPNGSGLSYQWRFCATNDIPGATKASLTLSNVQSASTGLYSVRMANAFGAVVSSNATLWVDYPPLADASATRSPVISANRANATVILDGSRSSDPEGDPLEYAWWEPGSATWLASGMVAVVVLPVGIHPIQLVVSDGWAANTNGVTVDVLTTSQGVQRLIAMVNQSGLAHARPLLTTLEAALASVARGNAIAAANQLRGFQNKVRAQVAPSNPALAQTLIDAAQKVIEALQGGGSGALAAKLHGLKHQSDGKFLLRFNGPAARDHFMEASTNLVDWEMIGVAQDPGDGSFTFEDTNAAQFPRRFYRVVSP